MSRRVHVGAVLAVFVLTALSTGCATDPDRATLESPPPFFDEDRVPVAMRLFEKGRTDLAQPIVDELLAQHPDDPRADVALYLAAECRLREGRLDGAFAQYSLLIERFPASRVTRAAPARLYQLGLALLEREPESLVERLAPSFALAIDALSRVAIDFPGSEWCDDAWLALGDAHLREGRADYAAIAFDRLAREKPDSPLAEEACFRVAIALAARMRGERSDVVPLAEARQAAAQYLKRYGTEGRFANEALERIRDWTRAMADHERDVAAFYARAGNDAAALLHNNNADRLLGSDREGGEGSDSLDLYLQRFDRPPWERDRPLPPLLSD